MEIKVVMPSSINSERRKANDYELNHTGHYNRRSSAAFSLILVLLDILW